MIRSNVDLVVTHDPKALRFRSPYEAAVNPKKLYHNALSRSRTHNSTGLKPAASTNWAIKAIPLPGIEPGLRANLALTAYKTAVLPLHYRGAPQHLADWVSTAD